jgi:hypothetical protein
MGHDEGPTIDSKAQNPQFSTILQSSIHTAQPPTPPFQSVNAAAALLSIASLPTLLEGFEVRYAIISHTFTSTNTLSHWGQCSVN